MRRFYQLAWASFCLLTIGGVVVFALSFGRAGATPSDSANILPEISEEISSVNEPSPPAIGEERPDKAPPDMSVLSSGTKPMLARASLPAVEQVLEVVKAAPAPLWSLKSPSPRRAPEEAEDALDSARAALSQNRGRDAASILLPIFDQYRGTKAITDANRLLMDKAEAMVVQKASLTSFEEFELGFPDWETLGPAGKYAITDYYKEVFYVAQREGNEAIAAPYRQRALESSRRLIYEHPNDPLQNSAVGSYYDYGVEEGGEALRNVIIDLEELAARPQPSMNRLGARYNLAAYAQNFTNERGSYILRMSEVVEDFDAGFVDSVFTDPNVIYWVKSWLLLNLGQALRAVGRHEDAMDLYTEYDQWILGRAGGGIRLEMADLIKMLNPQDAFAQAKAYEGIVASMDKSGGYQAEYRARALHKLGAVYLNYGDYRGAAQILEQLLLEHPDDKIVPGVEQDLKFIYDNLYNSMEVYNFAPADKRVYAQVCGPRAIHRWLALRGTDVTLESLAIESRNDQHGASMFGLIEAAKLHGLDTLGVAAESVEQLPVPFVAHVDGDHFLLVLARESNSLFVSDNGADPAPMALADFLARWNGKALIEYQGNESLAALTVLDLDTLKGARGGTGSSNDNNAPPPPPPGPQTVALSSLPQSSQGSLVHAWDPWDGDTRHIPQTGMPGAPDTATGGIAHSGVLVPGGFLSVIPSGATVQLAISDVRAPVRGDLQLAFTRHYLCKAGFATSEYTDPAKPWSNNIGSGWTHNLNVHLTTSTPTVGGYPLTVIVYDETGEARTFARSPTDSTASEDIYYRSIAVYPEEKRQVLVRNKAAGTYILWRADNGRYEFSMPTTTTDRYARLEAIVDSHGNQITLEYDDVVGVGKLIKAYAPIDDPRYLEFTYTGNLISQASLKKDTTVLAAFIYTYNGNDELVAVEDPGENPVTYTYDTHGSVPASRYLTQLTDKNSAPTDLVWSFSYASGLGYLASQISINTADGLSTVYQRSLSTYIASVITYDESTPLSKYVYTPVGATGMPWHVDYYASGTATTFERWTYLYGTDGYTLEQIVGPGSVVLADYTHDAYGRATVTTDVSGYGKTLTYASADDALPSSITRRDGTSVAITYDANGRIENALETGVIDGTTYTYDSYGQIVTITDPLGNDTTFTYDEMGNVINETAPGGYAVSRIYDDFGNAVVEYDSLGAITQFEFDTSGCQTCLGSMGLIARKTDSLWGVTEYEYDVHGNLVREIHPDGSERVLAYSASGQLISSTDSTGTTLYDYDLLGRLTSREEPSGQVISLTYDSMGRLLSRSDGAISTPFTYDSYGNVLSETNVSGNDATHTYDAFMRIATTTDEFGGKQFSYDNAKDRLIELTDERNNTTTYSYDEANRLMSEVNQAGREKHFTYDDYGRRIAAAAGPTGTDNPIEHTYDDLGRLATTSYSNGSSVASVGMKYDVKGRTTEITDWLDPNHGLRITYDVLGRVAQIRDPYGAQMRYTYDSMGRVANLNDYFGNDIAYRYEQIHGKVSRIEAPGGKVWTFEYNGEGDLKASTAPNGMTTSYTYDDNKRVIEIRHTSGAALVERFQYIYNAAGELLEESRLDGSGWVYDYDVRQRLTEATRRGAGGSFVATYRYTYDPANNLLTRVVSNVNGVLESQSFTYDEDNKLATVTSNGGTPVSYIYDGWGRVVSKTDGTHYAHYTYTEGLQPTSFTSDFPGEQDVSYSHRGDTKRRRHDVPNEISFFQWGLGGFPAGMEVLHNATALKSASSGSTRLTFVPLNPMAPSTTVLGHLDANEPESSQAAYYVHDIKGSIRRAYDGNAARLSSMEYLPFGEVTELSGAAMPLGYRGAIYEPKSQEHYRPSNSTVLEMYGDAPASLGKPCSKRLEGKWAGLMAYESCALDYAKCVGCIENLPSVENSPWRVSRWQGCYSEYAGLCRIDCAVGSMSNQYVLVAESNYIDCLFALKSCEEQVIGDIIGQNRKPDVTPFFTLRQGEQVGSSPDVYRVHAEDRTYIGGGNVSRTWLVDDIATGDVTSGATFELEAGTQYNVTLRLLLSPGTPNENTIESTRSIYVTAAPVADFVIQTDLNGISLPGEVVFDNTTANADSVVRYLWNFGDGSGVTIDHVPANPDSGDAAHEYARPGNYTVTLTAIGHNGTSRTSQEVSFLTDPIPQFTWTQNGFQGSITLRDSSIAGNLPYEVREWDFDDDGVFESTDFASNLVETKTFASPNTDHYVTLRIGTEAESIANALHSVRLPVRFSDQVLPAFTVEVLEATGTGTIPLRFTENCQINSSAPTTITSWSWDFGDGSGLQAGSQQETHEYNAPGAYTVTLVAGDGVNTFVATETVHVYADESFPAYGVVDDFELSYPGAFSDGDWTVEGSGEWLRTGIVVASDDTLNAYLTVNAQAPPNLTDVAIVQRPMTAPNNRLNVALRFNEDPDWQEGEKLADSICAAFRTRAADETISSTVKIFPNKITLVERWGAFGSDDVEQVEFPLAEPLDPGAWYNVYIETYGKLRQVWIRGEGEPGGAKGDYDWDSATSGPPDAWRSQDKLIERDPPVAPLDSSAITSIHIVYLDEFDNYYPNAVWIDDYGMSARTGDFQPPFVDSELEFLVRSSIGRPEGAFYSMDLDAAPVVLNWDCESCESVASLRGVEYFRTTQEVNLNGHSVSELYPLTQPPLLARLSLRDNQVTRLSHLDDGDLLLSLDLSGNPLDEPGALDGAVALVALEEIYLADTGLYDLLFGTVEEMADSVTQGVALNGLSSLENLSRVDLRCTQVRNLYPLVRCPGIGSGDLVEVSDVHFDANSPAVRALESPEKGATVAIDTDACPDLVSRYRLSASVSGAGGTVLPPDHGCTILVTPAPDDCFVADSTYGCIEGGAEVTITPLPGTGMLVDELRVNGTPVELLNGAYTFSMDGDKHIEADFVGESILTLEFPTPYFTPEVYVDNGFIIGDNGSTRTIAVATGNTVTLTIPDHQLVNFDDGVCFSHWSGSGQPFDGSRDPAIDITVTDHLTLSAVGTHDFHSLEVRDDYGYPVPGGDYALRGSATFTVNPPEDLLSVSFPTTDGAATRYYILNGATTSLSPAPELGYALDHWEYVGSGGVPTESGDVPLVLDMTDDWTVDPVYRLDPHVLTVNINPAGTGRIEFTPDPINGDEAPGQRVEYFNPFRADQNVTVRAVDLLDSDYRFDHWEGGSIHNSTNHEETFPLTENTELTAVYIPSFALTVRSFGGGSVSLNPPGRVIAEPGGYEFYPDPAHTQEPATVVTVSAVEDGFRHLDHWIVDGSPIYSDAPQSITMDAAHDIVAVFLPGGTHFRFAANVVGEGAVHLAHSAGLESNDRDLVASDGPFEEYLPPGASVTATQTPASGWVFDHWIVNDAAGVDVVTGPLPPVTESTEITAVFRNEPDSDDKVTLTLTQTGEGNVIPAPGITRFDKDAEVIFTAEPAKGWLFSGWSGDITSTDITHTVSEMSADMSVHATFEPDGVWYSLNVVAGDGGSVTPVFDNYASGASVTVIASPAEGWEFDHWEGDDVDGSDSPSIQILINSNKQLKAFFAPLVKIQIPPPGAMPGGTFEIQPYKPEGYKLGDVVTFTPIPDPGWEFDHWQGDISLSAQKTARLSGDSGKATKSSPADGSITTAITTAPYIVWAVFKQTKYSVSTRSIGEGTIWRSPNKNGYIAGERVKLVALPGDGMELLEWRSSSPGSEDVIWEFDMPPNDVYVEAVFVSTGRTFRIDIPGWMRESFGNLVLVNSHPVTMYPSPGPVYEAGTRVVLAAPGIPDYTFLYWTGDISGDTQILTIPRLTSDITVAPVYAYTGQSNPEATINIGYWITGDSTAPPSPPILTPAPKRTVSHDCRPWYEMYTYSRWNPRHDFCHEGTARYCGWTYYYDHPIPEVTVEVPGAKTIGLPLNGGLPLGEENSLIILGTDSVTVLPSETECHQWLGSGFVAYDVDLRHGRVDLETFRCWVSYIRNPPVNTTLETACGTTSPVTCLAPNSSYYDGSRPPYLDLTLQLTRNHLTIVGGTRLSLDGERAGWVLEEGEYLTIGDAHSSSGSTFWGKVALAPEHGLEVESVSYVDTSEGRDVTYTLRPDGREMQVSATATPGGTVEGAGIYPIHETVTLVATPRPGYKFKYWELAYHNRENVPFSTSKRLELTSCQIVEHPEINWFRAVFEANCRNVVDVDLETSEGGVISRNSNYAIYDCNETISLEAVPDIGFTFVGWTGDLQDMSTNPISLPTSRNWNVGALFEPIDVPGFIVALDTDGDGVPEANPEGVVQLVNVPDLSREQYLPESVHMLARRIGFEVTDVGELGEALQRDKWEVSIEQDTSPELLFFATNAWTRRFSASPSASPQYSVDLATVIVDRFKLSDLDGLGVYALAYNIPEQSIPHDVTATFQLYKNGVLRAAQDIRFRVIHGAVEGFELASSDENPASYSPDGMHGTGAEHGGIASNGAAGDPVYQFSGEFTENMTDLRVSSPGFDFDWSRVYRSKHARNNTGVRQFVGPAEIVQEQLQNIKAERNPIGEQWDYAYNVWVRRQNDGRRILVHDGRSGREEIWEREGASGPWTNGDYPTQITMEDSENLSGWVRMTYADKTVYEFYPLDASSGGKRGRLRHIKDRFGNQMDFHYEELEDGSARLSRVVDTAGRSYRIRYYDTGRISRVTDFTGRSVYYSYDGDQLTTVRDSRGWTVNRYSYVPGTDLIDTITDGNGQVYLDNDYDTASADFMKNRVTRQIYGDGVYNFSYELLGEADAMWRVTVNDPEGNIRVTVFDDKNRTRSERVYAAPRENADETTAFSALPTDPSDYFETTYSYQGDTSLVTRIDYPGGDYETFTYGGAGSETEPAWWTVGNMRTASHYLAGGGAPITQEWDYAEGFGNHGNHSRFVARYRDGRGNETLTTHTTEGNPLTRTYAINGLTESFGYNAFGQMTSHTHPVGETGPPRVDTYGYRSDGYLVQQVIDDDGLNLTTVYVPNARGLAEAITDPNGNTAERRFDHRDRLVLERTPTVTGAVNRARETVFKYDGNNNLRYTYTENFDEEGTDDDSNEVIVREIRYNTLNSPTDILEEVEEGEFIHTHTDYDRNENPTVQWSGEAVAGNEPLNYTTYEYNTRQLVVAETRGDPATQDDTLTIRYTYDANGNARQVTQEPSGTEPDRITYNQYDGFNRLHYVTDPMGNVTEFSYDENGNITRTILWGEVSEDTSTVPADGADATLDTHRATLTRMAETTNVYDNLNRKTHNQVAYFDPDAQTAFLGGVSTVETVYNLNSTIERVINANGHATEYEYDTAYRLITTTDAKGNQIALALDDNGNVTRTTETAKSDVGDPDAVYYVDVTYDELNRPIQTENNAGHVTVAKYDSRGNVVYAKDAEDNVSRFEYDGLSRLLKTTRIAPEYPADVTTEQGWDDNSRLAWQEDPNGNRTTNVYDALDRLDKVVFADATEVDYTYDSFGNVKHKLDANLTAIVSTYDALNRLTDKTITPDDPQGSIQGATFESYQYDSLSNTTVAANDFATVTRTFDSMSNMRSETIEFAADGFTKTISHTYGLTGDRESTTYPAGRTVTHAYDELERISTIHSSQGGDGANLLASYDYVGAGRVERRTMAGNGTRLRYAFDAVGRVNATTHEQYDPQNPESPGTAFDARTYTWDKANNKTQRVELAGGVPVKTYDYQYDSLNRLERSIKTIGAAASGAAGNWTGAMALNSVTPDVASFTGGAPLQLNGDFSATFDPGTLGVYITKTQGARDETVDYAADLQGYTATQIDALAPARPDQGTFDIYASALDGGTRVYSNPVSITYGPHVTEYDLDGAGNREAVKTRVETAPDTYTDLATAAYSEDDATPAPADAQMNQYTLAPGDIDDRVYDENGNTLRTGQALPAFYEHDYRDRIVRAARAPEIDSANGVPAGSVFSDDFATGLDAAWEHNPASAGGVLSAPWPWNAGGYLAHGGGPTPASSALPRTNPDGDFWWVYTRPSGASGNDVLDAYLRITGQNTDTTFDAEFLKLDIDADGISLWREGTGGQLASAPVATANDTPYLIHAHVFRDQVVIRRGPLGQPLATVLRADNAPVQGTDRFILEASNACLVDDVNIGDGVSEYVYDALGRRIEKRSGGGATRYLHDGARVAEEWNVPAAGSPALAASYVYGNYIDEVLTMRRGGADYYYHADDQHNVVKLTDGAGAVVEAYDYADYGLPEFFDAAGARLNVTASQFANPYLFTGRQWDAELSYYYYRNRYLDPAHGRFASRDPLGLWGDPLNLGNGYTYAASNPWSLVDPFGLCSGNGGGTALNDRLAAYAQGNIDFGLAMVGQGIDFWYGQINPMHRSDNLLASSFGLWTAASNPAETAERVSNDFSNYVGNFSDRDLGRLAPEVSVTIAGAVFGAGIVQAGSKAGILGKLGRYGRSIPGRPGLSSKFGSWWKDIAGEWRGWKDGFADTGRYRWEGRNGMRNAHAQRLNAAPNDNIHHRIIAQGGTRGGAGRLTWKGFFGEQYGRYVPNFIKNSRWNITNLGQPRRFGGTGLHEALHRINPEMPLNALQRIWYGSNVLDKAIVGGAGIGMGAAGSYLVGD
ncbi:MAG: PKD domain-containing protein [Candidatus Hydrogenedentes bacterium]|nr:PKD domain-containing protein [Candidatus Hydrogenedentota bacterium]